MADEKAPMPAQPQTAELPKPTALELQLAELLSTVRATRVDVGRVEDKVDKMEANNDLLREQFGAVKEQVRAYGVRQDALEERANSGSLRVRTLADTASKADLDQAAQLAAEREARESLAKRVDDVAAETARQTVILTRVDRVLKNPIVQRVASAVGTAVLTYLAMKGIK